MYHDLSMDQDTIDAILRFRDSRGWKRFHSAKDLALSITLESAELLELFQWVDSDRAVEHDKEHMADELADILIYAVQFSDLLGFDLDEIVKRKLAKCDAKYPVARVRDCTDVYDLHRDKDGSAQ